MLQLWVDHITSWQRLLLFALTLHHFVRPTAALLILVTATFSKAMKTYEQFSVVLGHLQSCVLIIHLFIGAVRSTGRYYNMIQQKYWNFQYTGAEISIAKNEIGKRRKKGL